MGWFRLIVTWVSLSMLLSACGGNSGTNSRLKMGGAIQGTPLALSPTVATFAGSSTHSSIDGNSSAAGFWNPAGITTDGTDLFVADSANFTIRRIDLVTGTVTTIAGNAGNSGSADGTGAGAKFNNPQGITTDGINLYIADAGNHTIRKVELATGTVTTIAGNAGNSGSADGTGAGAKFNNPQGITTDGINLYITDGGNNTIRKVVILTGAVTTIAGSAGSPGSADGTGAAAGFSQPRGITTDGTNLFITDFGNDTIRKIGINTGVVTTLAGSAGNPGIVDGTGGFAKFNGPTAVTTDGRNLYVTDDASTIRKVTINAGTANTVVPGPNGAPVVINVPVAAGAVTTLAGSPGLFGSTDGSGDFISNETGVPILTFGPARFWFPQGITTDGRSLFVADSANNMIRKVY